MIEMGSEIVLASHNRGKITELEEMLSAYDIIVKAGPDFNLDEPEENGASFEENSAIKARYFADKTGIVSLADDSGLVIPALDGQPGIYSARWAGPGKDFTVAFERIAQECEKLKLDMNGLAAYFVCAITLAWPSGQEKCWLGKVHGTLVRNARGEDGFGYDPIFIPEGETQTFAQLPAFVKASMSHRHEAMSAMFKEIEQYLG